MSPTHVMMQNLKLKKEKHGGRRNHFPRNGRIAHPQKSKMIEVRSIDRRIEANSSPISNFCRGRKREGERERERERVREREREKEREGERERES